MHAMLRKLCATIAIPSCPRLTMSLALRLRARFSMRRGFWKQIQDWHSSHLWSAPTAERLWPQKAFFCAIGHAHLNCGRQLSEVPQWCDGECHEVISPQPADKWAA
eukprot:7386110-Prymnesium_polylepis.1